jgi:hypothetical protein
VTSSPLGLFKPHMSHEALSIPTPASIHTTIQQYIIYLIHHSPRVTHHNQPPVTIHAPPRIAPQGLPLPLCFTTSQRPLLARKVPSFIIQRLQYRQISACAHITPVSHGKNRGPAVPSCRKHLDPNINIQSQIPPPKKFNRKRKLSISSLPPVSQHQ